MAHTLTFNYDDPSSGYTIRKGSISGEEVHSPYTLHNGDELYFVTVKINNTINGTSYSSSDLENTTLEFTDVDINIVGASGPQLAIDGSPFVLKYTESVTPTLTFKHFYDAGTIGSGTVKFRHYSQTEPAATVIKAGTYQFNEELTYAYSPYVDQELNFTSNSQSCYAIGLDAEDTGYPIYIIRYTIEAGTDFIEVYHSNEGWTNASYKTIIIDTSQTVTEEFYTWFTANTTKLS